MAVKVPIPKLGESEETVTIQNWRVREGDKIKQGDVLFEIETDKTVLEVESQFEGTLLKIVVPAGVEVPVLSIGAIIGEPGEAIPVIEEAVKVRESRTGVLKPSPPAATSLGVPQKSQPWSTSSVPVAKSKYSPRARSLAKNYLIDLDKVFGGSGDGRVTEADVKRYLESSGYLSKKITPAAFNLAKQAKLELLALAGAEDSGRVTLAEVRRAIAERPRPLSRMRKVIAKRLTEAKQKIPHFYVTVSIDMGKVQQQRAILKKRGVTVSVTAFVVQAAALALRELPVLNSECDGNTVKFKNKVNLGIAIDLEDGLVVPVIRDADGKSLDELQTEISRLAEKARAGTLGAEEMSGGSFTVSNLGMFAVENFAAIINPGESGILAVSSISPVPVVTKDGTIVSREIMKVTLSADHRVADGVDGAKFVNSVKAKLENYSF
ncbi:MAG: dihydrolipoamide acetyltransferase family protein [Victivallaceae bacterium]|nr:dihydrolipoamide acetyltransferase family protein [Victivallaceae bacterium]